MKIGLIIFISILSLLAIFLIFYTPIKNLIEKLTFKNKTAKKIYQIAKDYDYYLLNKVAMKIGTHVIHFDHILFADKYIYCIVTRYYPIAVNGNFDDTSWFNYKMNGKCKIMKNPMRLNRERVDYFATAITSSKDLFIASLVVNNSCLKDKIKGASDHDIIVNIKDLEKTIVSYEKNQVDKIEPDALKKLVQDIYSKCVEEK